jgi:hypothetical protein
MPLLTLMALMVSIQRFQEAGIIPTEKDIEKAQGK